MVVRVLFCKNRVPECMQIVSRIACEIVLRIVAERASSLCEGADLLTASVLAAGRPGSPSEALLAPEDTAGQGAGAVPP